jgi:predicted pyridoxine 5'-phosphate oxidase superfamily flavin-nucleotide-binding protein
MKIPQSLRAVIKKGPYAHLTTLNRDGSPQVTVVWVGTEGEEFVMGHLAEHQKVRNIRRDAGDETRNVEHRRRWEDCLGT